MKHITFTCFTLVISTLLVTSCQQCRQQDCTVYPGGKKYELYAKVTLDPARDTFMIGDTIWVTVTVPQLLKDSLGNQYDIAELDLTAIQGGLTGFFRDGSGKANAYFADPQFDIISAEGSFTRIGTPFRKFRIEFTSAPEQTRRFKCGFIPRQKGIFQITFFTPAEVSTGLFDDFCYSETLLLFDMNENRDDNNYHLIEPFGIEVASSLRANQRSGAYAFVVQ